MKKSTLSRIIKVGLPMVLLNACGSDALKNKLSLKIQGTEKGALSASSLNTASAVGTKTVDIKDETGAVVGSLLITKAQVALKEIEFESEEELSLDTALEGDSSEEVEDSFDFKGPYIVDLVTDTVSPELGFADLPPGIYKEIELKLDKVEGDELDEQGAQLVDASDPLFGNCIYIEGTYTGPSSTGAQTDIPFKMSFALDEEFELSGPGAVSNGIDVSTSVDVIIAFRLQKWFAFDSLETNSDGSLSPNKLIVQSGEIVLDDQASGDNDAIRDMIKENIKDSADYGEDKDDDGVLESDEDDDEDDEDDD